MTTPPIRLLSLIAALALLIAACSSATGADVASLSDTDVAPTADETPDPGETDDEAALLAFAACMREQGVEDFEDPDVDSTGGVSFGLRGQGGDVDRETMRTAMDACRDHLDGLAIGPGSVDRSEIEDELVEFAACMRDNGYDMPDPDFSGAPGGGGPFAELDPDDPAFQDALEACEDSFGGTLRFGAGRRGAPDTDQ